MTRYIVLALVAAFALPGCVVHKDEREGVATRDPDTLIVRDRDDDVDIHVHDR